jgi:hypothetical protein
MFDRVRRKKRQSKETEDLLWTAKDFEKLVRPAVDNWPRVRKSVGPWIQVAGEKLGDIYASVATVVTAQKEAFDDRVADRRERKQAGKKEE